MPGTCFRALPFIGPILTPPIALINTPYLASFAENVLGPRGKLRAVYSNERAKKIRPFPAAHLRPGLCPPKRRRFSAIGTVRLYSNHLLQLGTSPCIS
jgi:hypothetical protein